jgi:cold shock CspA family protein
MSKDYLPESEPEVIEPRLTGVVKWFNNKSGFGFITVCNDQHALHQRDIFVFYKSLRVANLQYRYLVQGEYVDFTLVKATAEPHEFQAVDITGVQGGPLMCETRSMYATTGDAHPVRTPPVTADRSKNHLAPHHPYGSKQPTLSGSRSEPYARFRVDPRNPEFRGRFEPPPTGVPFSAPIRSLSAFASPFSPKSTTNMTAQQFPDPKGTTTSSSTSTPGPIFDTDDMGFTPVKSRRQRASKTVPTGATV